MILCVNLRLLHTPHKCAPHPKDTFIILNVKRYICHFKKGSSLGEYSVCKLLLTSHPVRAQISYEGVSQVFLARRKIINDTREILSTPAVKLSSDPDAWNLKLIICRLCQRLLIHRSLFPFPLGTQLFTGAATSGKHWVTAFLMRNSIQASVF